MFLIFVVCLLAIPIRMVEAIKEIIVERPFDLRACLHDSQTASVQFEIARDDDQRTCQMYKFTIRRNLEHSYSTPEQNLTFWRNSLEFKHLSFSDYTICAIICSEHLKQHEKSRTTPIIACVNIHASRSHLFILKVYFLAFSQIIFTLHKRKFQERIKLTILQSLITLPASPIEYSISSPFRSIANENRTSHPIIVHPDTPEEQ